MKIFTEVTNSIRVIRLAGALDAVGVHEAGEMFLELALQEPSDAIIDLREVNYIDTSGLGILVAALKRLRSRGNSLFVENVRGQPLELFSKLQLLSAFSIKTNPMQSLAIDRASTWTVDRDAA